MNNGHGPPAFKINGRVHHQIGSLLPPDGSPTKFLQLYVYDTSNEIKNIIRALHPEERSSEPLDPSIIKKLIKMLDEYNPFAKKFRMARDRLRDHG
uniref:Helitron helicase-like domain-containing protein n=1 Tax=Arundo donax TaxID=35708 RepID=A0A0A9A193_ARUDO